MDLLQERKRVLAEEKAKRDEATEIRERVIEALEIDDAMRLKIFDAVFSRDLIKKGEAGVYPADKSLRGVELHYSSFEKIFGKGITSGLIFDGFKLLPQKEWKNIAGAWSLEHVIHGGWCSAASSFHFLGLSSKELDKVLDVGMKEYGCLLIKERKSLLFGGATDYVMLKMND